MSKLDYLMSTLNVRSVQIDSMPGGGIPELTANDVAAGLGMRSNGGLKLSPEAFVLGCAIHLSDPLSRNRATQLAIKAVSQMFDEEGWSPTKPFQQKVNDLVKSGELPDGLAKSEKEQRGKQFIVRMALLAVDEMIEEGQPFKRCKGVGRIITQETSACRKCKGNGFHVTHELVDSHRLLRWFFLAAYRQTQTNCSCDAGRVRATPPCSSCEGNGRIGYSDKRRAQQCDIGYESWKKTWRQRYLVIMELLVGWQNEYEAHAIEKC